jgi:OOP family OmpA-OmpF porin
MADTSAQDALDEESRESQKTDELDKLRRLLFAPEQDQLVDLERRINGLSLRAEDVGSLLPEAITLRSKQDNHLTSALMPTVEEAIGISVKKDPKRLVDAIFPVMGPAIRKAISHALREMVQSLNQALEHSLSVKGLKWRLEALRTGHPFAEVVLRHTLLYRVEQVFLIHRETGLLLQHVADETVSSQDPELVSGMLTAIQDFVQDSFGGRRDETLESVEVGDLTVWVEQRPYAVLAAAIRGSAPMEFRGTLQDSLDAIHFEQRDELEKFNGDPFPFEAARPRLEECLRMQLETKQEKPSIMLWAATATILAALAVWLFFYIRGERRWQGYLDRLNSQPGIVVVSSEKQGGKYHITGLRDPLAADPSKLLEGTNIDPSDVASRWENYYAAYPDFIITRAKNLLEPPETVSLSTDGSVLKAEGYAPRDWISQAKRMAALTPGVVSFDMSNLFEGDQHLIRQQIENRLIQFDLGKSDILPSQERILDELASDIRKLRELLLYSNRLIHITVTGYTDPTGTEALNQGLRRERAAAIRAALSSRNVSPDLLTAAEADAESQTRSAGRKVVFKVSLFESAGQTR